MLAKLTPENQLTLPKQAVDALGSPAFVEVIVEPGRLVLTPATSQTADAVRRELEARDISEGDVADAVAWARKGA